MFTKAALRFALTAFHLAALGACSETKPNLPVSVPSPSPTVQRAPTAVEIYGQHQTPIAVLKTTGFPNIQGEAPIIHLMMRPRLHDEAKQTFERYSANRTLPVVCNLIKGIEAVGGDIALSWETAATSFVRNIVHRRDDMSLKVECNNPVRPIEKMQITCWHANVKTPGQSKEFFIVDCENLRWFNKPRDVS